ncbi:transcriptional regulator, LacI family [Serinicoccus hydrothermalis]|uniref:Transcriptional regulator, LacI family n=1 Tax=Serinicoccus hydrothermalis TaxID=1758689 RepID=A0A1B1NCL5_9MICO|nr:LacI family DNA-binding transcriptional regulator [Serinicoccus hydrothermalis]ANS79166.1 transcriptional regulator, LacI family [Serinicoccus hydrothermalis]
MSSDGRTRRPTIYSVADRAQVSIATVSRVLRRPGEVRPATRDKVLQVVEELGYVPDGAARSLAVKSHEAHGLVLPELGGPYYADLLTGYEQGAAEGGASVVVLLTDGKEDVDLLVRRLAGRVDGIVLMGAVQVSSATVSSVRGKLPVLALANSHEESVESFATENVRSAQELTTHLLDVHGRRRLRFVGSPDTADDVEDRYAGFVAAHEAAGLEAAPPVAAIFREEEGPRVASLLLEGGLEADGLVCANDELALAVMRHLLAAGVDVPGEVSITGWDDVMAARYVTPGLTTVSQPVRELGRQVAVRMRALLEDRSSAPEQHVLPTSPVIRQSCGCP